MKFRLGQPRNGAEEVFHRAAHPRHGVGLELADFQKEGEARELFKTMIREITALAEAMGVPFQKDMVDVNLKILSNLAPEATTSMQRDIMAGKQSEIDGLVYEVVRMGEEYHVPVPAYKKVAESLRTLVKK